MTAQYAEYADRPATPLQEHFATWILEKTGIEPSQKYESVEDAFDDAVRLGVALRMEYQASPENRKRTAELREAKEAEQEKAREERKAARAKKDAELEEARAKREQERKDKEAARLEKQRLADEAKAAKAKAAEQTVADEEEEGEGDETPAATPAKPARKGKVTAKAKSTPAPVEADGDDEEGDEDLF